MIVENKVMLVTGAAQRIGAYIAQAAHVDGYNIVLHYRSSAKQTQVLKDQLNAIRANSCISLQADFNQESDFGELIKDLDSQFGRLDVLVNNASDFFPTRMVSLTNNNYEKLFNSNVKGPLFLSKACYPLIKKSNGTIINLVDIHADKPLKDFPVYSMAKAANKMMVMALAKEYAPDIRVNGISPGCIIWPDQELSENNKQEILNRIALNKHGSAKNIYQTLCYLVENEYMTGQIINVDGGRSLNM
jgi:pteridine reductase